MSHSRKSQPGGSRHGGIPSNLGLAALGGLCLSTLVACSDGGGGGVAVSTVKDCVAQAKLSVDSTTSISSATLETSGSFTPPGSTTAITGLPPFCRVVGVAKPTSNSNINFEVWMPTSDWNGKYLSVTEGGFAGAVGHATLSAYILRGYAAASTDTGHAASDTWWMVNQPERVADWGWRGKHLQTVAAKALIRSYYGEAPKYSYHAGCSNGGRQGLMELQRFPDDYDGYVIGAPANNWTAQTSGWLWKVQALFNDPASTIPQSKLPAVQAAALAQCDAIDGVTDSIITNPRQCTFNPDVLACPAGGPDADTCLTPPQLTALKKIYQGPRDSSGRQLFPGDIPGAENQLGFWTQLFMPLAGVPQLGVRTVAGMLYNSPEWDFRTFNFDRDPAIMEASLALTTNATLTDLTQQKARGMKIIHYHGWSDPALAPDESIKYYDKVTASMGGAAKTQDFYRLFMVPSMTHCSGGVGPNLFGQAGRMTAAATAADDVIMALENWVEKGKAPEQIIATKYTSDDITKPVVMRRPLCPYPKLQKYSGVGSANVETSFSCVSP